MDDAKGIRMGERNLACSSVLPPTPLPYCEAGFTAAAGLQPKS